MSARPWTDGQSRWTTKHDNPQDGWTVDFDFFDSEEESPGLFDDVSDCGSVGIFDESGAAIGFAVSVPFDFHKLERNARLISAAPDLAEALIAAREFIRNGIELGYIRMPESDTPDPAHKLGPAMDAALAKAGVQ